MTPLATFRDMPWSARIGLAGLVLIVLGAVFADVIAPYGEREIVGRAWEAPSATMWLGADKIGRDIFSRLLFGARTTLLIAAAATALSFALGVTLAFIAATRRGIVDQALSRVNDLLMAVPTLVFALVVLAALPQHVLSIIGVMAVLDATRVYRVGRAVALDIVVMDFVEVARLRGERSGWIVFREILPNAVAPLLAEFGLRFAFAVLFVSTLSFLGLGVQPPEADWGGMVRDNKDGVGFGVPAALIPGAAIAVLAICVNLVVDWLLASASSLRGGRDG